jgi:DNA-binding GntR family transcriptional regulator
VVASLSERDVEEFYSIKSILEGYAARMAAERMSPRDIERLVAINEKLEQIAAAGDIKTFFRVHNEFHDLFIKAAGNDKLGELINQLVLKFNRLRLASLAQPGRMIISVQEHRKIIDAFRRHDGEMADNLVRHNATIGAEVLIQSLGQEKGQRSVTASLQVDV